MAPARLSTDALSPPPSAGEGQPAEGRQGEGPFPHRRLNPVEPRLRDFAREQRSAMPRAEEMFWREVRAGRLHGTKWKRQVPITPYVVDFLCASARLIVELDGPPHDTPERRAKDAARDARLRAKGFHVLRFSNDLVIGGLPIVIKGVLAALREASDGPSPCLPPASCPSPAEGGGKL